jgi:uroporphyrin-III C-methyltransferase/precorrin-2 dehydrogenase/sirohydrochlorin ferrochelatase
MQDASRQPSDPARGRIGALSVLPVFLDLAGKRAVVAGGSNAAAWKAELLAAAGARVEVFADDDAISEEMAELLAREPLATMLARRWQAADLAGAAVALADAEDDEDAAAFHGAARAAGVPCNVIDRPAFCDFQFGAIVNRSPVVVGISTSGAAPILGQAIRRRIETLLPPSLAAWGAMALRLREAVATRLVAGAGRRAFWEHFVDRAFGAAPSPASERELAAALAATAAEHPRQTRQNGHVTFVGAGPGEAELLTLKAVRALQAADAILFDDLVSDEVLELARREAKRIFVGKRAGRPSCKQSEINATMLSLARAGRRVVRLKSGDPMIFGRAGEEIAELEAAGIGYEVVPGITAGLALAAALGVSLTHRDTARSVRLVTGHSKNGGLPADLDWRAIADPTATTIFYMGGRTAQEIVSRLTAEGLSVATPAVVGVDLGRGGQRIVSCEFSRLPETIEAVDSTGPVVIGIGRVFAPREVATSEVRRVA